MWPMTETTDAPAGLGASANGTGPPDPPAVTVPAVGGSERVMFAVMLIAGAGLLFLAVDGLSGYALSRVLFRPPAGDDDSGG